MPEEVSLAELIALAKQHENQRLAEQCMIDWQTDPDLIWINEGIQD